MNWSEKVLPEDAFDTLTPLHRILKMLSLTNVDRNNKQLIKSYSKPKRVLVIIILVCTTIIITAAKIMNYYQFYDPVTNMSIKFTDSLQVTYLLEFGHFIVGYFFLSKYGGEVTLSYFKIYDQIDKSLGMTYNRAIKSKVGNITAFTCFVCIFSSALDCIAWAVAYGWIVATLYSIEYLFFILNTVVIIDVIANVILIQYRLRTMGDSLQDYYTSASKSLSEVESLTSDNKWIINECKTEKKKPKKKFLDYNYHNDIVLLNKCYLLLLQQITFINKTFGFRVLINNVYLIICMVNSVNIAIRIAKGIMVLPEHSYFPALTSVLRTLNCALILVSLVHQCERSYGETDRILAIIDHILIEKNINASIRNALTETRTLVLTRPIQFDAMKFYKLDYRLLDSAVSVFVTMTVILLQNMQ